MPEVSTSAVKIRGRGATSAACLPGTVVVIVLLLLVPTSSQLTDLCTVSIQSYNSVSDAFPMGFITAKSTLGASNTAIYFGQITRHAYVWGVVSHDCRIISARTFPEDTSSGLALDDDALVALLFAGAETAKGLEGVFVVASLNGRGPLSDGMKDFFATYSFSEDTSQQDFPSERFGDDDTLIMFIDGSHPSWSLNKYVKSGEGPRALSYTYEKKGYTFDPNQQDQTGSCSQGACVYSTWSSWSLCTGGCSGRQSRDRFVADDCGATCSDVTNEERECEITCLLTSWTPWTACSADCGLASQSRDRSLTTAPSGCESGCADTLHETRCCSGQPRCTDGCTFYVADAAGMLWYVDPLGDVFSILSNATLGQPSGVDFDPHTNILFWSSADINNPLIYSAQPRCDGVDSLSSFPVSTYVDSLAVDSYRKFLLLGVYDEGLLRTDYDGLNQVWIYQEMGNFFTYGINLDIQNQEAYWTHHDDEKMYKSKYDLANSPRTTVVSDTGSNPAHLVIDNDDDRLYWILLQFAEIRWVTLSGSQPHMSFFTLLSPDSTYDRTTGLRSCKESLYFNSRGTGHIHRVNISSGQVETVTQTAEFQEPYGLGHA